MKVEGRLGNALPLVACEGGGQGPLTGAGAGGRGSTSVVRGGGQHHQHYGDDTRDKVAKHQEEEDGGQEGLHLGAGEVSVEEVPSPPQGGRGVAEAGGRRLGGAEGRLQGQQVQQVTQTGGQGQQGCQAGEQEAGDDLGDSQEEEEDS